MSDNFKYISLDDLIALRRALSRPAIGPSKINNSYQNSTSDSSSNNSAGLWIFLILVIVLIVVGFIYDSKYYSAEKMFERYRRSRAEA